MGGTAYIGCFHVDSVVRICGVSGGGKKSFSRCVEVVEKSLGVRSCRRATAPVEATNLDEGDLTPWRTVDTASTTGSMWHVVRMPTPFMGTVAIIVAMIAA